VQDHAHTLELGCGTTGAWPAFVALRQESEFASVGTIDSSATMMNSDNLSEG